MKNLFTRFSGLKCYLTVCLVVCFGFLANTPEALASRVVPMKIMALNGFPDLAAKILEETQSAQKLIQSKLKPSEKRKKLLERIKALREEIEAGKAQLAKHDLPVNLFEEVELDLNDAQNHVERKEFQKASSILGDYKEALQTYVWTLR